jgi:hypothetical protein
MKLSYLSVLHASVNWVSPPNQSVAKTLFSVASLLSICHSSNYEVLSATPGKF